MHCQKTAFAHWQARNIQQRQAAQTAIGWENGCEKALGKDFRSRNNPLRKVVPPNTRPTRTSNIDASGSNGASYVSGTAEDLPPSSDACLGSSRTNCIQYSEGVRAQAIVRRRASSAMICLRAHAQGRMKKQCFFESNCRSGQAAETAWEGRIFLEMCGGENGILRNSHNQDNGIQCETWFTPPTLLAGPNQVASRL